MKIYNYVKRLLQIYSSEKITFTTDKKQVGDKIWHFYSDLFWHKIPTGLLIKKGVFVGFKNSKTGDVFGNYIRLSSKAKPTKDRLKKIIDFYTNKIITGAYQKIPFNINDKGYNIFKAISIKKNRLDASKGIDFWGCAYIPKTDFDFKNFEFKSLDNMETLQSDITLADCFFDMENENTVLLENEGDFNTAVISKYDISNGWKKISDDIMVSGLHSSYPISFKYNKKIYALPNIFHDVDKIDFFVRDKTGEYQKSGHKLDVENIDHQDFTPFEVAGRWYAFGANPACDLCRLYVADNPFGKWLEHKSSPINMGLFGSRPAGNVINHNGNMYRLAQNCQNVYGGSISIFKILKLNLNEYKEQFITELKLPESFVAFHTFNVGKDKVLFDYRKYK